MDDKNRRPPYLLGNRPVVKCTCGARAERVSADHGATGYFFCHICGNEYDVNDGKKIRGWEWGDLEDSEFGIPDQEEFDTEKCPKCKKLIHKTAKHNGYRRKMTAYTVRLYEALPQVETGWVCFCAGCEKWFYKSDADVPFNFVCRNGLCGLVDIRITAERDRQKRDPPRSWTFKCLDCELMWNYNRDYQSAWEQKRRSASPGTPPSSDTASSAQDDEDEEEEESEDYDPERESSPEE